MNDTTDNLWTISELAAEAATALSSAEVDQASGRVSEVPSTRTIRYYTTHGLLERPLDFRGRTALYGRRHLLQIVAIKRLQSRGTPLTEIQSRLVGASDEELEILAEVEPSGPTDRGAAFLKSRRRGGDFWAQAPAEPSEGQGSSTLGRELAVFPVVRLADGVALMLDGAMRDLHPDDVEAISVAAEPLIKLLKSRNLVSDN